MRVNYVCDTRHAAWYHESFLSNKMFTLIVSPLKLQLTLPKSEYVIARSVLFRLSVREIRVLILASLSSLLGSEVVRGRNHRSVKKGG